MLLAEKNTARFAKANAKREERKAALLATQQEIAALEESLEAKYTQIKELAERLQYKKANSVLTPSESLNDANEVQAASDDERLIKPLPDRGAYEKALDASLAKKGWSQSTSTNVRTGKKQKSGNHFLLFDDNGHLVCYIRTSESIEDEYSLQYCLFRYGDNENPVFALLVKDETPESMAEKLHNKAQELLHSSKEFDDSKFQSGDDLRDYLEGNGYTYKGGMVWSQYNKGDKSTIKVQLKGKNIIIECIKGKKPIRQAEAILGDKNELIRLLESMKQDTDSEIQPEFFENNAASSAQVGEAEKPIELTGTELGDFDTDTPEGKKALREAAFDYLKELAQKGESVYCSELQSDVHFNSEGAKKHKRLSGNPIKNQIAGSIKQIIAKGKIFKPSELSYDATEKARGIVYHYLKTPIAVDGQQYGVRIVIKEQDKKFYYDLQVKDSIDAILDSLHNETPQAYEANKSPVLRRSKGDTLDFDNIPMLPNRQALFDSADEEGGWVLNLFLTDANGNPIPDEDEETETLPEEFPQQEADKAFLQSITNGSADMNADDFVEKLTAIAERYTGQGGEMEELVEQASIAFMNAEDKATKDI